MDYKDIIFEAKNGYAIITFNRPKELNPLNANMKKELSEALTAVENNPDLGGVIIAGAGKAFMAGTDLNEIDTARTAADTVEMSVHGQELMNKIERLKKPVIAAIHGYALGGGAELALACDLRIASWDAVFGMPEADLGVAPCYGGTQRLARLCGAGIAKDLLLTARQVPADECLRMGIFNRVVDKRAEVQEAEKVMKQIIRNGPEALTVCKRLVDEGLDMSFEEGLKLEADLNGYLAETEFAKAKVAEFQNMHKH